MPLKIITGDIMQQECYILVMPAAPRTGPTSKLSKNIYSAAGYEDMMKAREKTGSLSDGEAAVTSGFGLNAEYVIHTGVPEWAGGFSKECLLLARCYAGSLKYAAELEAESIAFPLLGAGTNRFPLEKALTIAKDTIEGYLRAHSIKMNVYLVIHPRTAEELNISASEVQHEMPRFCKGDFVRLLNGYIDSISKFSKYIGLNKSTLARIMNGSTEYPQKRTVILIALGLGLSKDKRYELINSSGNMYPVDERDIRIEELLKQGCLNIDDIESVLYDENPAWTLRHKCKGDILPHD